jgi:hypothetical protein
VTSSRLGLASARRPNGGFSLAELLLAIFILGIGVISVAAIFPAGITLQRQATDDSLGPTVAHSALSLLRSRLSQDDFGGFDDFNAVQPPFAVPVLAAVADRIYTMEGDWPWMRPGFIFDNPNSAPDEGRLDIFSQQYTRKFNAFPLESKFGTATLEMATELPSGWPESGAPKVLWGIPYNPAKYAISNGSESRDWQRNFPEPRVFIAQRERYWPIVSGTTGSPKPQYVWDCMFRRFGGRVQVAIFVYRVTAPGGAPQSYRVAKANTAATGPSAPQFELIPPLPISFMAPQSGANRWAPPIPAAPAGSPIAVLDNIFEIPGTASGSSLNLVQADVMWQVPGQWILDQNNNIHRVLNGRRTDKDGPVRLSRPIPRMTPSALYGRNSISANPADQAKVDSEGVSNAWYLPLQDAKGNQITPVYLMVEEL